MTGSNMDLIKVGRAPTYRKRGVLASRFASCVNQIPDAVTQAKPPVFEFGQWAIIRAWGETLAGVLKHGRAFKHLKHVVRVIFPIGGTVQNAANFHFFGEFRHKIWLDQSPFVVARFSPGVGKVQQYLVQAVVGNHVAQHVNHVVGDDANVFDALLFDLFDQRTHTGGVNFDTEIIHVGVRTGDFCSGFAHAKADLKPVWGALALPCGFEIDGFRCVVGDSPFRHALFNSAFLRPRNVPSAFHIAFDVLVTKWVVCVLVAHLF